MTKEGFDSVIQQASIFVSELRLPARVGVNPGEQGSVQPIIMDVWVLMDDMSLPARSEQLTDTLDYVAVARTVRRVVEKRHYPLVETLATKVAQSVLTLDGVKRVKVRLQKPACLKRASSAGVEVELAREERQGALKPIQPEALVEDQSRKAKANVVVVGGGAGGLSAALWCRRLGHPALLIESNARLGGQLHMVHGFMPDIPGMKPMDGPSLIRRLEHQFQKAGGSWLRAEMTGITDHGGGCGLVLELPDKGEQADELKLQAKAVILALGSRRRALGVPGERELLGKGLLYTAARGAGELAGRRVLVVGGGDSACENALILHRAGARVTLVHRGEELSAREQFAGEIKACDGLRLILQTTVTRFHGAARLEGVTLSGPGGGEEQEVDAALVRIGWQPNSGRLPPSWLDQSGFVRRTGEVQSSESPRIFVAGEVGGGISPAVVSAFGSGAAAAAAAVRYLEGGESNGPG